MRVVLDLQQAPPEVEAWADALRHCAAEALSAGGCAAPCAELTLRFCDEEEMRRLNCTYRGVDRPTNVLTFPFELPAATEPPLLGDVLLCPAVLRREADEQHRPLRAHLCHLLVHGCLHLLHYDHEQEEEARVMENLESAIMARLGFPDPYVKIEEASPPGSLTGPAGHG